MGFWIFGKKRDDELERLHNKLNVSFENIKNDISSVDKWVKHLDGHRKDHHSKIESFEDRLNVLESIFESLKLKDNFVGNQTSVRPKRTSVHVQTPVQTAVQLDISNVLRSLTVMERAVMWILLNTDLKMSYDDLSAVLGKDKSTLRGQINNIKRKSENLIGESMQKDGKKRFFIKEDLKEKLLKSVKKRV